MQNFYSLIFLLCVTAGLPAQVAEPFSYPTGVSLDGQNGGSGWPSGWVVRKGNDQTMVSTGGLTDIRTGARTSDTHLSVLHRAGQGGLRAARRLPAAVTDDGSSYYLAWFQENDFDVPGTNGSVAQVILTADGAFGAGGPGGQLVRMGKLFGTANFGIDGGAVGASTISATDTRMGYSVVVRIDFSGDETSDSLRIFLNPDLAAATLDPALADTVIAANLNGGFDAIGLKVEGPADLTSRFDEIRFGSSFDAVRPGDLTTGPGLNIDNFNAYPAGTTLAGSDAGVGWGGPWVTVSGDEPEVVDGGLANYALLQQTSGNHVAAGFTGANGDSRYYRLLNTPFLDDGSRYYFSYTSRSGYSSLNDQADFFMLLNSAAFGPSGPGGQLLQIGKPLNSPFIGAGFGATANFALTGAEATATNLVVVEVLTSGNGDVDTVRVYLNPDPDDPRRPEPDAEHLTGRINDGFDAVGFKATGTVAGNTLLWDDVYVGRAFSDVLPQDYRPVAPLSDAFATETFNSYTSGDTLGGLDGGTGWAGPWLAYPSSDRSTIAATGVVNGTLGAQTSGRSLSISTDGTLERSIRIFASPIDTVQRTDVWFSAHLGAAGNPAGTVGNLILVDTTVDDFQQIIIGKQFGTQAIFAVGDGQVGGPAFTGETFEGSSARFVVGHLVRAAGFWELDLYVDPDPTASDLTEDAAQVVNKRYRSGNLNGVALRVDGAGNGLTWEVDDLYFGEAYADVIPPDLRFLPAAPAGASETFAYAPGTSLSSADGGTGWGGPWTVLTEGADASVVSEGISSETLLRATSGSSLEISEYLRAVRPLAGTYGDFGREFWVGWWFSVEEGGANVANLVLADTAAFAAAGPGGQLVQIGKAFGGTSIGIQGAGSATGASTDDGHFMVLKVVTDGTAVRDTVYLWVDPDLTAPPATDTAHVVAAADLTNWNAIGVKFEGDAGESAVARFDDIIVGLSYADVVPLDLVAVNPPNRVRPARETFAYAAGSDLGGADGGAGWSGPWEALAGTAIIAEGNVDSPRTCADSTNSVRVTQAGLGTPTRYRRSFFNPFGVDEDSETFFASFVLNGTAKDIGNSALVSFVSGDENVLSIGGVPGLSSLAVIRNDEEAPRTSNRLVVQGTKWLVVRMDIDANTGLATARVFVDPAGDAIPPDESAVFTVENVSVLNGITGIEISGAGAQSVELNVDDIRAGSAYRDISCSFGSDDPDLLAYEPFNYDAMGSLVGAGGENAFWDGPWVLSSDQVLNTAIVREGSLNSDALAEEGNRAELSLLGEDEQLRIDRPLAFPLTSDGRTYWLSFLMNTTDGAATANVGNVVLRSSGVGAFDGQRIIFGRIFGEGTLGSAVPGGATRRAPVADEGLHWMVVRMQTDPASDVDTFTVWIDPPASSVAPDTTSPGFQQYFLSPALKEPIDVIRLRVEGAGAGQSPYVTEFDEIALATRWSSIVNVSTAVTNIDRDPFGLSVFPNPTSGIVTVAYDLPAAGEAAIEWFGPTGQRLWQKMLITQVGKGQVDIPAEFVSRLPTGPYFVRFVQAGRSSVRRVVVVR